MMPPCGGRNWRREPQKKWFATMGLHVIHSDRMGLENTPPFLLTKTPRLRNSSSIILSSMSFGLQQIPIMLSSTYACVCFRLPVDNSILLIRFCQVSDWRSSIYCNGKVSTPAANIWVLILAAFFIAVGATFVTLWVVDILLPLLFYTSSLSFSSILITSVKSRC